VARVRRKQVSPVQSPSGHYHLRWMIRKDWRAVLGIEAANWSDPMTEKDLEEKLRDRAISGFVAQDGEHVVGFMIYELSNGLIRLLDFGVHPACQRRGVGRAMIEKLIPKLGVARHRLVAEVHEGNLDVQLFFRAMGFKCVAVQRRFFDNGDDAYRFVRTLDD